MIWFITSLLVSVLTSTVYGSILSFSCAAALTMNWWQLILFAVIGIKIINYILALIGTGLTVLGEKVTGNWKANNYIALVLYSLTAIAIPLTTVWIYIDLFGYGKLPGGFLQFITACACWYLIYPNMRTIILMEYYKIKYHGLPMGFILRELNNKFLNE